MDINKKIIITGTVLIILLPVAYFVCFRNAYYSYKRCGSFFNDCVSVGVNGSFGNNLKKMGSVKEGEEFESLGVDYKKVCEKGLIAIEIARESKAGCAVPMCPCFVCTKCGDGICGKGENSCNCKEDCSLMKEEKK